MKKFEVYERLESRSKTFDRLDPADIEKALGALRDKAQHGGSSHAFSIWALRSRLLSDLVSTGGRPGRREAVSRKKIPMTAPEWMLLDTVTELIKDRGVNVTAGQVAGILLQQSLAEVLERLETEPVRAVDAESARQLTDAQLEETLEGILAAAASAEAHLDQLKPVARELLRRMRSGKGAERDPESIE